MIPNAIEFTWQSNPQLARRFQVMEWSSYVFAGFCQRYACGLSDAYRWKGYGYTLPRRCQASQKKRQPKSVKDRPKKNCNNCNATLALVGGEKNFSWREKSWSKILTAQPRFYLCHVLPRETHWRAWESPGFDNEKNIYLSTFKNTRTMAMKVKQDTPSCMGHGPMQL